MRLPASMHRLGWYAVAYFIPAVCTLGLTVVVGRSLGPTEELGEFWLLYGVSVGVANAIPKWLQQAVLRWGPSVAPHRFEAFVSRCWTPGVATIMLSGGVVLAVATAATVGGLTGRFTAAAYSMALATVIILVSLEQARLRAARAAAIRTIDGLINLVGPVVGFSLLNTSSEAALIGLAVSEVALACALVVGQSRSLQRAHHLDTHLGGVPSTVGLVRYGGPMVLWLLANQTISIADRYVVDGLVGAAEAGLYASTYMVIGGMVAGIGAPIAMWLHPEYMARPGDRDRLKGWSTLLVAFGAAVIALGTATAGKPLELLLGFRPDRDIVAVLAVAVGLYWIGIVRQKPIEARDSVSALAAIGIVCAVFNVGVSIALVSHHGPLGAGIATLATYLFYLVLVEVAARLPSPSTAEAGLLSGRRGAPIREEVPGAGAMGERL